MHGKTSPNMMSNLSFDSYTWKLPTYGSQIIANDQLDEKSAACLYRAYLLKRL